MQVKLALLIFLITSAVCGVDFMDRFAKGQSSLADETHIMDDFTVNAKVLNEVIVKKIFDAYPKKIPEKMDDAIKKPPPVVRVKVDELSINGKLYRLSGVFMSKQDSFAVVESRDAKTGGDFKKQSLHVNDSFDGYTVDFIQTDKVKMSNKKGALVFEMYKKPSLKE